MTAVAANPWVLGARPRTLPASVVPVLVGTAAAVGAGGVIAWRFVAALIVALALQVATNYANDYSDGVRGTDDGRVGPLRLVASGTKSPASVKRAAFAAFGVAALAGLALSLAASPWLLVVGGAAIAAGWFYTGGSRPYGYAGLGEVFVFVFFGLVATVGSTFVQLERVTGLSLLVSLPVGLLICALLVANNLRDIPTDAGSGKRTLAVRLGDGRTRAVYVAMVLGAFATVPLIAIARPGALVALGALVLARTPLGAVRAGAVGPALIPVLGGTAKVVLLFGLALSAGLMISP